jgi:outer membrane protein TolC
MTRGALSLMVLGSACGCKVYHALPSHEQAKREALATPDLPRILVEAKELRHPLLKPLVINLEDGLSPDEAAVLAVLLNPELKGIRDQRALAEAQLLDAGLLPDPILSFSQDVPTGGNDQGAVTAHSTQLSLDLTSLLTRGLRRRAARAAQQSVDLDVAWQEWQVAEAAKLSVYRLVALDPQVECAEKTAEALEENLRAVEQAAERGDLSQSDVASALASVDAGRRNALSVRQARERERQSLNALLGLPPEAQLALEKTWAATHAKRLWEDLPSGETLNKDLDKRLDLVALQKGYESQDARVRLAIWSQFPSIGLSLSQSRDTANLATRGYGVALSLPLFNRGQGLVAMETATRQQLYDQYLARLFRARAEMAQILADMKTVQGMIDAAESPMAALTAQAEASDSAFAAGQLDLLSRNQIKVALLSQRATQASLEASLEELGGALEIASGHAFQPKEGTR